LCQDCREAFEPSAEAVESLELKEMLADNTLYRARGCKRCGDTGYRGRAALVEMLPMTDSVRRLILRRSDSREIEMAALSEGMRSLYEDGLRKAAEGVTSLEEVLRVTRSG
jgi:general secretion pathway protein E